MEILKKYYKRICVMLLCVMLLVSMVKGCSKSNNIRMMKRTYASADSIMTAQSDSIDVLWDSIDYLNHENDDLVLRCNMYERRIDDLNRALGRSVVVKITNQGDGK